MRSVLQDLAFAFRQFSRHRLYALAAIVSLALGIGATTAVFSVLYGVLLEPFPYRDSAHMVDVVTHSKDGGKQNAAFSLAEMQLLRRAHAITDVTAYHLTGRLLTGGEFPQSIHVAESAGNLFQFLGPQPFLGRYYTAAEALEGTAPPHLAVVSYRFWRSHLAGSAAILGTNIEIDHQRWTVIGVMGPRFTWLDADVYVPFPKGSLTEDWFPTIVRIRPDLPKAIVVDELSILMHQIAARHPSDRQTFDVDIESLNDNLLGEFKGTLLTLFVAVFFLLLISCGNVSILLLARGASRQYEMSMRTALGASRRRLARQLLTEAVSLSAMGGLLGVAIAYAAVRLLVVLIPEYAIPHEVMISLNVPVLLFCLLVAIGTGVLSGLSPALQMSGSGPAAGKLQAVTNRTVSLRRSRSQGVLIVAQIALTILLLTASGAAMRRYLEAERAHLGFDPKNVLLLFLGFPEHGHEGWSARVNYEDALLEKMKSVPGVRSAAVAVTGFPPSNNWLQQVDIVGSSTNGQHRSVVSLVSAEYFAVLRVPLLEGRVMTRNEVLAGAHTAVVSRLFADRFFSGGSPLGRQVTARELQSMLTAPVAVKPGAPQLSTTVPPDAGQPFQIVGVVNDVRNDGLHQPTQPALYLPSSAVTHAEGAYFVRKETGSLASVPEISAAIGSVDAFQAVDSVYTYEHYLGEFVWSREQFVSSLFSLFAAVALGLASIGLISTIAFQVEQRTHEIGIRYALGSTRFEILRSVLTPTAWLTLIGIAVGILLSAAISNLAFRWIQSSMRSLPLLAEVSGMLFLVAALAGLLTARRAMLVNPVEALRAE